MAKRKSKISLEFDPEELEVAETPESSESQAKQAHRSMIFVR